MRIALFALALAAGVACISLADPSPRVSALIGDSTTVGANSLTADTLAPPTDLQGSAVGLTTITLTWTPSADAYADGYYIERATSLAGPYTQVAQVTPGAATQHVDAPPVAAGTYYYRARTFAAGWESVASGTVTCTAIVLAFVCS